MPKRLVITNGDWVTRHEIGDTNIVIGRDPNCDLFFVNQKLSRRHARVEPGPDGVRLVDLGSRNGVWVNEKKIGEHLLAPGDSIRVGGLDIVYEEEDVEPTLDLGQADSTIMLSGAGSEQTESPDATVVLSSGEANDDGTVVLGDGDSEPDSGAASTVILQGGGEPAPSENDGSTRVLASSDAPELPSSDPVLVPEPEPLTVRVKQRLLALSWQTKLAAALFALNVLFGGLFVWILFLGSTAAGILFGLLFAALAARSATDLAQRLLVAPLVKLRRNADDLEKGNALSEGREYSELEDLAKSINRVRGLTGGMPESASKEETD